MTNTVKGIEPIVGSRVTRCLSFLNSALKTKTDECIMWPFGKTLDGYGTICVNGRKTRAHVLVCERAYGERPSPVHEVAHNCHNPSCINAAHLRWATRAENQRDRIENNTTNRGERHACNRLSEQQVHTIRRLLKTQTRTALAKRYGVSIVSISDIALRKTWAWLETPGEME